MSAKRLSMIAALVATVLLLSAPVAVTAADSPETELSAVASIVPESPIGAFATLGYPSGDADSPCAFERFLAEEEVSAFLDAAVNEFQAFVEEQNAKHDAAAGAKSPPMGLILHVMTSPMAGYLSELSVDEERGNREPEPARGAVVFDLGDRVDEALKMIHEAIDEDKLEVERRQVGGVSVLCVKPSDGPEVEFGVVGTKILAAIGKGEWKAAHDRLNAEAPTVLQKTLATCELEKPLSVGFLDIDRLRSDPAVNKAIASSRDMKEMSVPFAFLGVDSAKRVAYVSGLDADGMVEHVALDLADQDQGFVGGLLQAPLTKDDFARVPADAIAAIVVKADGAEFMPTMQENFRKHLPEEADQAFRAMERDLRQLSTTIKGDVYEDLFDTLGDLWCVYAVGELGEGPVPKVDLVFFHRLKNADRFAKSLKNFTDEVLEEFEDFQFEPEDAPMRAVQVAGVDAFRVHIAENGLNLNMVFGLVDDTFVVAQTEEAFVAFVEGPGDESLADCPAIVEALGQCRTPHAIAYADTRPIAKQLHTMIPGFVMMAGFAAASNPEAADGVMRLQAVMSKLPSWETLEPYMTPTTTVFGKTESGVSVTAQSPFQMQTGTAVALLLPAVQAAREAARRMACTNNLKQLALAMHNYHDTFKSFPAATAARPNEKHDVSWRVKILPFMEQMALYDQYDFDQPWDSEHNLKIAETLVPGYLCPSCPPKYKTVKGHRIPCTNYVMVAGKDSIGDPKKGVRLADITDGSSNTIMIVEVKGDAMPAWTEPVDLKFEDVVQGINLDGKKCLGSWHPGGCNVAFCDGSVHFIAETIDLDVLKHLLMRNDGQPIQGW